MLPNWWRNRFLLFDGIAGVFLGVSGAVLVLYSYPDSVGSLLPDKRGEFYGALFAGFSTLLGFTITAYAIISGYSSHALVAKLMRGNRHRELLDAFIQTCYVLGISSLLSLGAMLSDREKAPSKFWVFVILISLFLSLVRVWRCLNLLKGIGLIAASGNENYKIDKNSPKPDIEDITVE
jgi:drug/metabolite transporter (DMT)-like permease